MNDFELIQYFQDYLIMCATGDGFDKVAYAKSRKLMIENKSISHLLSKWVNNIRTIDQFSAFITAHFSTYQERREFIWNEFNNLLSHLETGKISPLNEIIVF